MTFQQRLYSLSSRQRHRLAQQLGLSAPRLSLVAYVVPSKDADQGYEPDLDTELSEFLQQRLSSAMIPSNIICLDEMPRTATGKLDRKSLPEANMRLSKEDDFLVLPITEIEVAIAAMWTEVLEIEPIGIHDNFFDIGGDSLLVTRVVSRIRQAYELEISPKLLFEMPTLVDLAAKIEALKLASLGGDREEIEL